MLNVVHLGALNDIVADLPMDMLLDNAELMRGHAMGAQSTAGLRKTAWFLGWGVRGSLECSEVLVLLSALDGQLNWLVGVLDSVGHEIGAEMTVNTAKMPVIADAHLSVS
jgi:hypothetical protein